MRSFVALAVPEPMRQSLVRVQDAVDVGRSVPEDNMHLTLAFLGDVSASELEALHHELAMQVFPPARLAVQGLIGFGGRAPKLLAADVVRTADLTRLHDMVVRAVRSAGLWLPRTRFRPHVTLIRFGSGLSAAGQVKLDRALIGIAGLRLPPVSAETIALMESTLTPHGAIHAELARYPVGTGTDVDAGG